MMSAPHHKVRKLGPHHASMPLNWIHILCLYCPLLWQLPHSQLKKKNGIWLKSPKWTTYATQLSFPLLLYTLNQKDHEHKAWGRYLGSRPLGSQEKKMPFGSSVIVLDVGFLLAEVRAVYVTMNFSMLLTCQIRLNMQ